MLEQVFWDNYFCPMQNPNPSNSPSVYICVGFTKAQQLAEENKKPAKIRPLSLQISALYYTYLTVFDISLLISLRARGSSPKLTCIGVTIMFGSKKEMSGRACSRQIVVYLNL